jgi:hypothetical protein
MRQNYSALKFHQIFQANTADDGLILSLSQFLQLPQMPQNLNSQK